MATRYNYTGGIVTDGLVLHFDAAKKDSYPGSGTTWYDLSGNGNEGVTNNTFPTFTGTAKDAALDFDGTSDNINLGDFAGTFISDPSVNGYNATVSVWCYAEGGYYILASGAQSGGSRGFALSYQNGSAFFSIAGDQLSASKVLTANFNLNEWVNFTGVADGTTWTVYKNGSAVGAPITLFANPKETDAATNLFLGVPNNATSILHFNGKISNVKIYNRALTASEISQNFNALRGRYGI